MYTMREKYLFNYLLNIVLCNSLQFYFSIVNLQRNAFYSYNNSRIYEPIFIIFACCVFEFLFLPLQTLYKESLL